MGRRNSNMAARLLTPSMECSVLASFLTDNDLLKSRGALLSTLWLLIGLVSRVCVCVCVCVCV